MVSPSTNPRPMRASSTPWASASSAGAGMRLSGDPLESWRALYKEPTAPGPQAPAPIDGERWRVELTLGENTPDIDFPLSQGLTLSGTVRDEAGRPVSRVPVTATWGRERKRRSASSQADGSFRLAGLRETEALQLEVGESGSH